MSKTIDWISETEASSLLHMDPVYMRKQVKNGSLPINFTRPHRLCHLYDRASIEAYLISCSSLTHSAAITKKQHA